MSLKKLSIWILISQLFVFAESWILYKEVTLLAYINISFVIGCILVLISLFGFVVKGRFFDIVFGSFQNLFGKMEDKDREPLSKLMSQSYRYPLATGFILLIVMFIGLMIYY